jgi:hypothetical protein
MARAKVRTVILCEDRAQEHFLRRLVEEMGHVPVIVVVAPKGRGSAEQWVRMQYPPEVKKHRGRGDEQVALVVMTDGDRYGVAARKQQLSEALAGAGHEARGEGERIPICIPTWSIETWFAWLCGLDGVDEATQYNDKSDLKSAQQRKDASPTKAAEAWRSGPRAGEADRVPSLHDGRHEMERLS